MTPLLDVRDLSVRFGSVLALNNISLSLQHGARLGVVGESGSGKSTLGLATLGLLSAKATCTGEVQFKGQPLPWQSDAAMTALRGSAIGFVHQDPMSAFSPVHTIGTHLIRAYRTAHPDASKAEARKAAIERLDEVEITNAKERLNHYPHEYSGGMRQRVMIAAALIGNPDFLIADEPTTALDVTTQAAVLRVIDQVIKARNMGLMLITHDLGVVAEICSEIAVMYRGTLIQQTRVSDIHANAHPYTEALLKARPRPGLSGKRLPTITELLPEGWFDA